MEIRSFVSFERGVSVIIHNQYVLEVVLNQTFFSKDTVKSFEI